MMSERTCETCRDADGGAICSILLSEDAPKEGGSCQNWSASWEEIAKKFAAENERLKAEAKSAWARADNAEARVKNLEKAHNFHKARANKLERLYDDMATARSKAQGGKIAAESKVKELEVEG